MWTPRVWTQAAEGAELDGAPSFTQRLPTGRGTVHPNPRTKGLQAPPTASNSACSFPNTTESKQNPTHLSTELLFLFVCFYPSTCLRPVPRPVRKKRGTGEERRGGCVSSCARSLRESVRHLVRFLTWTESKIRSQRSPPRDGFMSESLWDFSLPLRTQIQKRSCLAPTTLQNWTARPADEVCCHQFEWDRLPVLLSK